MKHNTSSHSTRRCWQRWLPPAVATSASGTSLVIWFEEVIALATEFIGVIVLPALAGIIYLLNNYIFKSALPQADDLKK